MTRTKSNCIAKYRPVVTGLVTAALAAGTMLAPAAALAEKGESATWQPAVDPKPLSDNIHQGLTWLVKSQHENGGWGQGEESQNMGRKQANLAGKPNVADTCISILALLRSGSTPSEGPYAKNIRSGLGYLCGEVSASDADSLFVTSMRGTRIQQKLGTYVDTFLSSMVLAEAKGHMAGTDGEEMVSAALDKVLHKIEVNQRDDGSFGGSGWANTLSQAMASKGLNRAAQAGAQVDDEVRAKISKRAQDRFDSSSGRFSASDSAGVDLYASAATLGSLQDADNTDQGRKEQLQEDSVNAPTTAGREEAKKKLGEIAENEAQLRAAKGAIVEKMNDARFVSGFGSNGGEEFLSYMNIGESLVVEGGSQWQEWDTKMTANMERIQNQDGSWSGHHCITGRNFCTSAALLVLMTDRAPMPVAEVAKRR